MTGSSQKAFLRKIFAALLFAVFALVALWARHEEGDLPRPPSVPQVGNSSLTPQPRTFSDAREEARTEVPSWLLPSRSPSPADDLRFSVPPPGADETAPREIPPGEEAASPRSGDAKPDTVADARRDGSGEETAPAPGAERQAEPAPDQAGERAGPVPAEAPLIVYGKGKAVDGGVVRGEIPVRQTPPDTTALYGSPSPFPQKDGKRRPSPRGEDSVVGLAVIQNLAKFLADNYWPAGSHPRALQRGISTATFRWANVRFGAGGQGFAATQGDAVRDRTRVLNYAFMPSMIRALYGLYAERFLSALEQEALSQRRGRENRPLGKRELAEMYAVYGDMARGLAGTARAYAAAPDARALTEAYLDAERRAEEASNHFLTAMQTGAPGGASLAKPYQRAVLQREQQREVLLSSLRRSGSTRGIDGDAMLYAALWLYRRGEGAQAAMRALADVLDRCAGSLEEKQRQHQTGHNPPTLQTRQ